MKLIPTQLAIIASGLCSCTNITLMGHVAAYDVNAEFKGDPVTPVSMNAGFESHSFVAVPPEHSGHWTENTNHLFLPKGDVLPTISKLKIEGIPSDDSLSGVAFDFVSSGATGEAAIAAAGGAPKAPDGNKEGIRLAKKDKAMDLGNMIEEITTDPNVIPIR